ncbi:MAG TPA: phosphate signaling complex protein PhoU [Isosphaeraceae bacterium]|nr:phosphate signaling complex protein PhoU [Isosphaeraceae bacterium]
METAQTAASAWEAERVTLCRHFLRDMESLWEQILRMAAVVEEALNTSVRALCDRRSDLADRVHGGEGEIDRWEVQIERECLKVLALHQPGASDLRRVAAILRINNDLERMADLADHIANRARKLAAKVVPTAIPGALEEMALEALARVREALDALARCDAELARAVIAADRGIDRRRRAVLKELKQAIRREPERVNTWLRLINTARNFERIADHATNIAEAVIYLKEGDIIRHVARSPRPGP